MCVFAERESPALSGTPFIPASRKGGNGGERLLCKRNGQNALVCCGQKWCKVTGRFEMSDRVTNVCKFYKEGNGGK